MPNAFLKSLVLSLAAVVLCCIASVGVSAQDDFSKYKIKFAPLKPVVISQGDTATITIQATLEAGWWMYSTKETVGPDGIGPTPTVVKVKGLSGLKVLRARVLPIKKVYDEEFKVTVEKAPDSPRLRVLLQAAPNIKVGIHKVTVVVDAERCNSSGCQQAREFELTTTVEVRQVTATTPSVMNPDSSDTGDATGHDTSSANQSSVSSTQDNGNSRSGSAPSAAALASADGDIANAKREGLISFFLLGMLVGLGALATPCVYPMVPITVSFFTKRSEKNKAGQLTDAAVFAGGIVLTFTLIGIIVSAIWGASQVGSFAADPWTNLIIGLLFIVLAFNLFGAFEIQVPASILNTLNKKSQGTGYSATFLMGVTFAVISFTCTGAFVAGALGSANQGDYLYPTVGMLGFALSFAAPFFILALAPSLMTRLPRSGGWMNNVKVVLGFLEIAFALKFLSSADLNFSWGILPRDVVLAVWIGVASLVVLYLLGTYRMKLDSPLESVSGIRAAFAIVFASLAFWLFTGFGNRPLGEIDGILPPINYEEIIAIGRGEKTVAANAAAVGSGPIASNAREEHWFDNLAQAKAEAKKTGKPIFVDFTGFTCTNCRWMEQNMFTRPAVSSRMAGYILVRLFTDRREEPFLSNQRLQEDEYGSITLPLYVVLASDGSYVTKADYTRDEKKFNTFLDNGLSSTQVQ